MKELLIFILSTSGLTWIVVKSKLFKLFREVITLRYLVAIKKIESNTFTSKMSYKLFWFLNEVLNCEVCFGFWSGMINYILIYKDFSIYSIVFGFAGSTSSLLVVSLNKFLNKN